MKRPCNFPEGPHEVIGRGAYRRMPTTCSDELSDKPASGGPRDWSWQPGREFIERKSLDFNGGSGKTWAEFMGEDEDDPIGYDPKDSANW